VADYYTGGRAVPLNGARAAFDWLRQRDERRFLVVRAADLPEMNALFRRVSRNTPETGNLPVLDARSSEILLASNRLSSGEQNQNPFDHWILGQRPKPAQSLDVNLGNKLNVLGWEFRDERGRLAPSLRAGVPYSLVIFHEVKGRLDDNWDTFVHIDGFRRRYNGDHPTLQGKYPLSSLNRGEFIADRHTIELDPNFTPGAYRLYFGLYRGSKRLEVRRGEHQDDRIDAGRIVVR
jgi:hypothetical protein